MTYTDDDLSYLREHVEARIRQDERYTQKRAQAFHMKKQARIRQIIKEVIQKHLGSASE